MPATQIPNPGSVFAPYYTAQVPQGVVYMEAVAGSAMSATNPVVLATSGSALSAAAAASAPYVVGIALDNAATAGIPNLVRYITSGLASVSALTAITYGSIVSPSAGGVTAASATIGGCSSRSWTCWCAIPTSMPTPPG